MSKGYYLFKFDLLSGYHDVELFPDHRKYLAFAWDFGDAVLKYFQFAVLPLGFAVRAVFVYLVVKACNNLMEM